MLLWYIISLKITLTYMVLKEKYGKYILNAHRKIDIYFKILRIFTETLKYFKEIKIDRSRLRLKKN